jgi:hypothetical protein
MPEGPGNLPVPSRRYGLTGLVPGGAPPQTWLDVREINRYPRITTLFFSLAVANTPQLVVNEPDGSRIFLSVRNQAGSGGSCFVSFGTGALDNGSAFFLVAGAQILLDIVIPQDDVYIACDAATTNVVVAYAHVST